MIANGRFKCVRLVAPFIAILPSYFRTNDHCASGETFGTCRQRWTNKKW